MDELQRYTEIHCGRPLQWLGIGGMRVIKEQDGLRYYSAQCAVCSEKLKLYAPRGQCLGTLRSGMPCNNRRRVGKDYCGIHEKNGD